MTTEETDANGNQIDLSGVGARAVIGGSAMDCYGSSAGGVAYVNTFGSTYYDPGGFWSGGRLLGAPASPRAWQDRH